MIVNIQYKLKIGSPLHIGSGLGGGIKKMILKQSDGSFVIPGSTVKGRVRYYAREFARITKLFSENDVDQAFGQAGNEDKNARFCAFCDLSSPKKPVFPVRNGIQICRRTGTTKPHALFNTEVACYEQGEILQGKIFCSFSEEKEKYIALLVAALRLFSHLGGSKTTGMGKCTIPMETICVQKNGNAIKDLEEFLLKYWEGGKE
ncbi:MAG: hypothetical protein HUU50_08660 [Candidatus Brocadiae bacterium]|nr:hypothetical protein [Candidatus Brocadiia bacterium]